jgi:hypothetical protein
MNFNNYYVLHSQRSYTHVSVGIPAIFRVILLQEYERQIWFTVSSFHYN